MLFGWIISLRQCWDCKSTLKKLYQTSHSGCGTTVSKKTDCVNEFPHKHHVVYVCSASVPTTGCINRFQCYCINNNIRSFVEFCLEHYSGLTFFQRVAATAFSSELVNININKANLKFNISPRISNFNTIL